MKFPFVLVPRVVFDQMTKHLDDERERTRKLLRTIVHMKVAGGTVQRAALGGKLTPRQPTEFETEVAKAIDNSRHVHKPGIRAQLASFVEKELAKGTNQEVILKRLRTWSSVDGRAKDEDDDDVIAIVREA